MYKELQAALKQYKEQGLTTVKLNSKMDVLQAEYDRLKKQVSNDTATEAYTTRLEPVSEAPNEQPSCAVEPKRHDWYTIKVNKVHDRANRAQFYTLVGELVNDNQWLSCKLPDVTQDVTRNNCNNNPVEPPNNYPETYHNSKSEKKAVTSSNCHATPMLLFLTMVIVITTQLITTVAPIITYLYTSATNHVKRTREIRRRRSQWYAELRQLMTA